MIEANVYQWVEPSFLNISDCVNPKDRLKKLQLFELKKRSFLYATFFGISKKVDGSKILVLALRGKDYLLAQCPNNRHLQKSLYTLDKQKGMDSFMYLFEKEELTLMEEQAKASLLPNAIDPFLGLLKHGFKEFVFKNNGDYFYCLGIQDLGWKHKIVLRDSRGWHIKEYTNKRLHSIDQQLEMAKIDGKAVELREMLSHQDKENRYLGYQMLMTYER